MSGWEKINVMGVQLTYVMIQDQTTGFSQNLICYMHRRLYTYFLFIKESADFALSEPSRSGLGENHFHGCTTDIHHDSRPTNGEKIHKNYYGTKAILTLRYMYMYICIFSIKECTLSRFCTQLA